MGSKENFTPICKQRVIDALKEQDRTQKDMARWVDITPEHLSRCLKNGKIAKAVLIAIADYLDCSPEWLSGTEETAFTYTAYQRETLSQHDVLVNLFNLLGWSREQLEMLSQQDVDNMKSDMNAVIAYYVVKSRKDGIK